MSIQQDIRRLEQMGWSVQHQPGRPWTRTWLTRESGPRGHSRVRMQFRYLDVEINYRANWEAFVGSTVPAFARHLVFRSDSVPGQHIRRCINSNHPEQLINQALEPAGLDINDMGDLLGRPPLYSFREAHSNARGHMEEGQIIRVRTYFLMIDGVTRALAVEPFYIPRPGPPPERRFPAPQRRPNWQELQRFQPPPQIQEDSPSRLGTASGIVGALAEGLTSGSAFPGAGQAQRIIEGYYQSMNQQYEVGRFNNRYIGFVDHLSRWAARAGAHDERTPPHPQRRASRWAQRRQAEGRTPTINRQTDYENGCIDAGNLIESAGDARAEAARLYAIRFYGNRGGRAEWGSSQEIDWIRRYIMRNTQSTPLIGDHRSDQERLRAEYEGENPTSPGH